MVKEEFEGVFSSQSPYIQKEAKLTLDSRKQFLVRFPRKVAEYLDLRKGNKVEFIVDKKTKECRIKIL